MIFRRIAQFFESWIDPFHQRSSYQPPGSAGGFLWYFVSQAKGPFLAMLVLGGVTAMLEAALFWFTGRLVDILDNVGPKAGWSGLFAAHGGEILFIAFVVMGVRFSAIALNALVEEQTVVPGFFNLIRWQAHAHISRQSLSFFHNDFSGRIVAKVWAAGQASGDLMVSLMQVAWFMVIYSLTTVSLVASLDWRLGLLVGLWICAFLVLARIFVPKIRKHARETAEISSMLTGRLTDSYSNIQTLKLFGRGRTMTVISAMALTASSNRSYRSPAI